MSFRNLMTSLDDAERERLFRYFTPEALQWSLRTRGLDVEFGAILPRGALRSASA